MIPSRWRRMMTMALTGLLLAGAAASAVPAPTLAADNIYAGENGTPMVSYFYPEELLTWNPKKDKDLPYQQSTVPLAKRVDKKNLTLTHSGQNRDMKVLAISIMNSGTSGNPAQGSGDFMGRANLFSYWQYVDTLVYWGGSAGEGIIVPPGPDVVDAAHRNGVPVLGTVFFPTLTHGGKLEWVKQMLVKAEDGSFPAADQLLCLAEELGFDGWFLNQETEGTTDEDAKQMQEMIQYMKKKAPEFQVVYYDSMTKDGSIDWQNALTDQNEMFLVDGNGQKAADSMFLNFWWTNQNYVHKELLKLSQSNAQKAGISNYDLYAGVDIQAEGTHTKIRWDLLTNTAGIPYTSLGMFCPSWAYYSAGQDFALFQQREQELWAGSIDAAESVVGWKPVSSYKVEQSTLTKMPFVTNFNIGHGKAYYRDGKKAGSRGWNQRSVQDVLPTYRFVIENKGNTKLKADMDYNKAYNGGNSILVSGFLTKKDPALMNLYASDLKITRDTKVEFTIQSEQDLGMNLVITLADGRKEVIKGDLKRLDIKSNQSNGSWSKIAYSLAPYQGSQLRNLSIQFTTKKEQELTLSLGQLTILDEKAGSSKYADKIKKADKGSKADYRSKTDKVSSQAKISQGNKLENAQKGSVTVKGVYSKDGIHAGARVQLKSEPDTAYYELYQIINGKDQFAGITVNPNYYISSITRNGKSNMTQMKAVPVSISGIRIHEMKFSIPWGSYPVPKAEFMVDQTYITPGENVTFTSKASETTEKVQWKLPGSSINKSSKKQVTTSYLKEGTYSVTFTASNTSGTDKTVRKQLIYVSKEAKNRKNLALLCPITASGQTNDKEAGAFAVDSSLTTKWCVTGNDKHTIMIDLKKNSRIGEVIISHAEAGGEGHDYNTRGFHIEVSQDGKLFQTAAKVTDNEDAVSHTQFAPKLARYVKLVIDQPTQGADQAARIYDIQVIGTPQ